MTSTNTPVDRLKQMLALEQRRSALQQEIDLLTRQLNDLKKHLFDSTPMVTVARNVAPAAPAAPVRGRKRKGTKRGQLSAGILGALQAAGNKGITVGDLATQLGANYKNIYVWFATTGKKHPLKKLAPATYCLSA